MASAPVTGSGRVPKLTSAPAINARKIPPRNHHRRRDRNVRGRCMRSSCGASEGVRTDIYERLRGSLWPDEDVAHAANGADALGLAGVVPELLAQVRHVDVERAVDARIVGPALRQDGARELLASDGLAGAPREDGEHAELERRELKLLASQRRFVGWN